MSASKRAVVFAYSAVGCECLKVLLDFGIEVAALYTHEDDPAEVRWFDSVSDLARRRGVEVRTPQDLSGEEERVAALQPDVLFSFYYRALIPEVLLALPPLGAFNMHGSLLPRYRGRACVNWAVLNGETETGMTLHRMTSLPDRGRIVAQKALPVGPDETAHDLFLRLVPLAGTLLKEALPDILAGRAEGVPQDESRATSFGRRRPQDGRIDWRRPAAELHNLVRAVAWPFPGAFTFLNGRKLMVWRTCVRPAEGRELPGTVVLADPLTVASGEGRLQLERANWEDEPEQGPALGPGIKERLFPEIVPGTVLGREDGR